MSKDASSIKDKSLESYDKSLILQENELKKIIPKITSKDAIKINKIVLHKLEIMESFSGPLPPPNILSGYEKIKKGFADRIMIMAEEEQKHRHSFNGKIFKGDNRLSTLGLISGFIIAMTALIGGFIITLYGRNIVGFASIIGSLTALVTVFIVGKSKKNKNETGKDQ